jgi:hypothetical protein
MNPDRFSYRYLPNRGSTESRYAGILDALDKIPALCHVRGLPDVPGSRAGGIGMRWEYKTVVVNLGGDGPKRELRRLKELGRRLSVFGCHRGVMIR